MNKDQVAYTLNWHIVHPFPPTGGSKEMWHGTFYSFNEEDRIAYDEVAAVEVEFW